MNGLGADIIINAFAIIGIGLYAVSILQRKRLDGLEKRILMLLGGVTALMLSRVMFWITGKEFYDHALILLAFSLPLLLLITAEGVMRRHAALSMKWLTTLSALTGLFLCFISYQQFGEGLSFLLAGLQISTCLFCLIWISRGKGSDLTASERHFAGIFCIALGCIIPLILTDFTEITGLPVRLGGVGLLVGIFMLMRMTVDNIGAGQALLEITSMAFFSLIFLTLCVLSFGITTVSEMISLGSSLFAMFLAAGITVRVLGGYLSVPRMRALEALARSNTSTQQDFLQDALDTGFTPNTIVLKADALEGYDIAGLRRVFDDLNVVSRRSLHDVGHASLSLDLREQIHDIFTHHDATHLCMTGDTSPEFILFSMPPFGNERDFSAHVALIQKMTSLIETRSVEKRKAS